MTVPVVMVIPPMVDLPPPWQQDNDEVPLLGSDVKCFDRK